MLAATCSGECVRVFLAYPRSRPTGHIRILVGMFLVLRFIYVGPIVECVARGLEQAREPPCNYLFLFQRVATDDRTGP
jgi:hypothetical protein